MSSQPVQEREMSITSPTRLCASPSSKFSPYSGFGFQQTLADSQEKYFQEHPFKTKRDKIHKFKNNYNKAGSLFLYIHLSHHLYWGLCKHKVTVFWYTLNPSDLKTVLYLY
jgi:hypothetical protein